MSSKKADLSAEALLREAQLQTRAIWNLGIWLRAAASLAVIGLILAWWGFGMNAGLIRGVFGIILALAGAAAALIIKTGRDRGRKNVEKILEAAEAARKQNTAKQ